MTEHAEKSQTLFMTLLGVAVACILIFIAVVIYAVHKRLKGRRKIYSRYKNLRRADGPSLKSGSGNDATNSTTLRFWG